MNVKLPNLPNMSTVLQLLVIAGIILNVVVGVCAIAPSCNAAYWYIQKLCYSFMPIIQLVSEHRAE
jgi:hypothetical protein